MSNRVLTSPTGYRKDIRRSIRVRNVPELTAPLPPQYLLTYLQARGESFRMISSNCAIAASKGSRSQHTKDIPPERLYEVRGTSLIQRLHPATLRLTAPQRYRVEIASIVQRSSEYRERRSALPSSDDASGTAEKRPVLSQSCRESNTLSATFLAPIKSAWRV
jgi:hypothetical protein